MSLSHHTRSLTEDDMTRDLMLCAFREENLERSTMRNENKQEIFCKYWVNLANTNIKPKALVFICHGYAEHCLRYTQLAHALIEHNLYPFAHDHVGHGQSEGTEALIHNFDDYVRDAIKHIKMVKERFPGIPVYAVGHSMGGCIALRICLKEPQLISKLVVIGPACIPFKLMDNFCLRSLLRFVSSIFPELKVVSKINEEMLTLNQQQVALIKTDPLIYHGSMKAGFLVAFCEALIDLGRNLHNIHCPLLILHGKEDIIVPIQHSIALHEKASSRHKTLKIYPELRHQLHAEREPDSIAIRNEICEWILTDLK